MKILLNIIKKIESLPTKDSGKIGGKKLVDRDEVLRILKEEI